jgi:hypothetical protein
MKPTDTIIANLTKMVKVAKNDRNTFNKMVQGYYGDPIGAGAFRKVFDAGDFVVKLRRVKPFWDNPFPMSQIHTSNADEAKGYRSLRRNWKYLSGFVLKPLYVELPYGHDAIIMPKVERTCRDLENEHGDEWRSFAVEEGEWSPILDAQYCFVTECFNDSHDANLGYIGNRLYLIDINYYGVYFNARENKKETEESAKSLLEKSAA